ncbi:mannose-1-phosphate guanylyltransferase [Mangrovibacterium marinum]|uniref:mannose-1-phosphate guanylyltransferase n=1 Tax=Mangrovibacterium marinum TaxID=1639118 RepID=A0A2T5BYC9_9BACT|nr:mannose-1-phosphate guanylyltransferase [Mangrovibacterium marinum]PTN07218.1 mannose-1-phosphate guanylyltransferase [Mangrovibacterium marinum]
MNQTNYLVIMAGGIGSRFWPVSTAQTPKQFLDMLGTGRTLFQHTVDRFKTICPPENILVVTSESYTEIVKEQCPELLDANILAEPCMRNTAPCIAYASYKIKKLNPKANIVVSPADHLIEDLDIFRKEVEKGLEFTANNKAILTLGISPTRPETGYGYIETTDKDADIARVAAFKEKPNLATAQEYLSQGGYYWNAGIFFWSVSTIIAAFEKYNPTLATTFQKGFDQLNTPQENTFIREEFPKCESISIDYSVMEKADNLFVQKATFSWSDLGTWGSLWEKSTKSQAGNVSAAAKTKFYESANNLVHTSSLKQVIIQGLDDYIVVESKGTLLICKKQEEQRIKEFLKDLEG